MATPTIQPVDTLGQVNNILGLIKGLKGSTTTQTTSSNLTNEGAMGLINQVLQSTQGLASVAQGQKSAGMYNSTVNQQLINDLLTQTASKVASQQQGTTTTTKTSGILDKGEAGTATKIIAALQAAHQAKGLLDPLAKALGSKYGIKSLDDVGSKIADLVMGTGDAAGGVASVGGADNIGGTGFSSYTMGNTPGDISGNDISSYIGNGLESLGSSIQSGTTESSVDLSSFMASDISVGSPDLTGGAGYSTYTMGSTPTDVKGNNLEDYGIDSNFSAGSNASASSGSGTNYGSYLKVADYIDKPEKRGDILDLSDGDWKDDIADVTDAAAIAYPILGLVRPALNLGAAAVGDLTTNLSDQTANVTKYWDKSIEDITDSFSDPGQAVGLGLTLGKNFLDFSTDFVNIATENALSPDNEFTNALTDTASGIVGTVVNLGDMVGRAGETVGNAVGDLVSGIGDVFDW